MSRVPELQLNDPVRATHINDSLYHIHSQKGFYLFFPDKKCIRRTSHNLAETRQRSESYSKSYGRKYETLQELTGPELMREESHIFPDECDYSWWYVSWREKGIKVIHEEHIIMDKVKVTVHCPLDVSS